jgi:5-methylcytosine-specific restriction endonuclease McrA
MRRKTSYWYPDKRYQRKRLERLKNAKFICEHCHNARATHVHHRTYLRYGNEWISDLMAVCENCHHAIHFKVPANDNQLVLPFALNNT